jgi:thioredoxin reductase (NADPH)
VENVPGFPVGVAGDKLANNSFEELQRMGADTKLRTRATNITNDPVTGIKTITLSTGEKITTRAVVIAGGTTIKKYGEAGGPPAFPGSNSPSIIYGDSGKVITEAAGKPVVIIGGSNGASQAALAAAKHSPVTLIARSPLSKGVSMYQEGQLRNHKNITVVEGDEMASVTTDKNGKAISLTTKNGLNVKASGIGVFVGSLPSTDWLPSEIKKTKEGRIDADINMETSIPGVFAIGDIRGGVLPGKPRIGVAMGEGGMVVPNVFDYFKKQTPAHMQLAAR